MRIINYYKNLIANFKLLFKKKKDDSSWLSLGAKKKNQDLNFNIFTWDTCNSSSKFRLGFILGCFITCFFVISYRMIIISTNGYKPSIGIIAKSFIARKEIVDRNGNLLAVNLPSASLFANPQKVINIEASVNKLAEIISIDKKKLIAELKTNKSFVWIKRDLSPREQTELLNLSLPGFDFEREQRRVYTFGNLLSHVIGYVGRDFDGLAGIEKSCDKILINTDYAAKKTVSDQPLTLSIDVRLQNILNEEIEKVVKDFNAIGAVGIIVNPNNGEVLAMLSKPDFNPHRPQDAKPEQLFNSASLAVMELGSVFKSITMTIGLDTNTIALNDAYDLTYMKVGKFQVKDDHPMRGWHSVPEIFIRSSNIGTGQIMLEIGKTNFKKYLKNLGLLDQIEIELPERGTPLFPPDNRISDLSLITMSYGYGISNTALGFVRAMIPVVNGGIYYPLTLLKIQDKNPEGRRVLKSTTSKDMLKLYRLSVKEGSGKKADVKGYLVGGKTGTAFKASNGKYNKTKRISSFLSVFPANNPQYLIYIMVDEPKGNKESFGFATGGWTTGPATRKVIERMVSLYGIEPIGQENFEIENLLDLEFVIDDEV